MAPSIVSPIPATWPRSLIADGTLYVPLRVPRSCIPPDAVHRNAWEAPPAVLSAVPVTWPSSLIANAELCVPPGSVPRSVIVAVPAAETRNAEASAAPAAPTGAASTPVRRAAAKRRPHPRFRPPSIVLPPFSGASTSSAASGPHPVISTGRGSDLTGPHPEHRRTWFTMPNQQKACLRSNGDVTPSPCTQTRTTSPKTSPGHSVRSVTLHLGPVLGAPGRLPNVGTPPSRPTSAVGGEASLVVPAHPAPDKDMSRVRGDVPGDVGDRCRDRVNPRPVAGMERRVQPPGVARPR